MTRTLSLHEKIDLVNYNIKKIEKLIEDLDITTRDYEETLKDLKALHLEFNTELLRLNLKLVKQRDLDDKIENFQRWANKQQDKLQDETLTFPKKYQEKNQK